MATPNRLIHEKSPYLLQHAHNPVDWRPWGEEAFAAARAEQKPIFLSIGYSTCHWCHVMERESFENQGIADILNRSFISIKLDREERPDVDRVYMTFVQATTGSGGWPMSVFLTPDLKPFFGGTYFPPENAHGRPGFRYLLQYLEQAWKDEREKVLESGDDVIAQLQKQTAVSGGANELPGDEPVESAFNMFRRTFDPRLGGFGQAPKFPRPSVYNFLLRYWKQTGNDDALDMTLKTLGEMAAGGMYDQVGGGFHRYSVDERWFVPHFEKMLYDQAQLAISYLEAFQITREERLAHVARDVFNYVCRDLRSPEGAFYSAEDADSVIDPAHPHEKGEGAFYVWTEQEIEEVLGPDGGWFNRAFGVKPGGNVAQDPHQEFTGKNILYQALDPRVEPGQLAMAREKLLAARAKRVRPGLDDKILTSWNALMISAFALGSKALGDEIYLRIAKEAADFILGTLWDGRTLKRRYRDGEAAIDGFLDDYATFGLALLDVYEASFEPRYLDAAEKLAVAMRERFEDAEHGAFFSSAAGDPSLVLRMKEDYDGAEPGGNSMAALLLLRLSAMTGNQDFQRSAEGTLKAFASRLRVAPVALPQMLAAYLFWRSTPKQIVIAGENAGPLLAEVHKRFLPNKVMLGSATGRAHLAPMVAVEGKATAFVCENFVCQLPVTTPEELAALLDQ